MHLAFGGSEAAWRVGSRAGPLRRLTPAHFNLDHEPPYLSVEGTGVQNRRPFRAALNAAFAAEPPPYLNGRPNDRPVCPGGSFDNAAEMLGPGLAAAEVPFEAPEGRLDFHAWRHTHRTEIGRPRHRSAVGVELRGVDVGRAPG